MCVYIHTHVYFKKLLFFLMGACNISHATLQVHAAHTRISEAS